jgi:hypothetical protein
LEHALDDGRFTARFPQIAALPAQSCLINGEAIVTYSTRLGKTLRKPLIIIWEAISGR